MWGAASESGVASNVPALRVWIWRPLFRGASGDVRGRSARSSCKLVTVRLRWENVMAWTALVLAACSPPRATSTTTRLSEATTFPGQTTHPSPQSLWPTATVQPLGDYRAFAVY